MRFGQKYVFPPFLTLFWFLLGGAAVLISDIAVSLVYDYLCEILPSVFTRPGMLSDPEGYERAHRAMAVISVTITVLPATYLSMRLDNKRFEHLIVRTEGLYTVREELPRQLRSFWIIDLISATVPPLLLTLPVFFIPEKFVGAFTLPLWCGGHLMPWFGAVGAALTIVLLSVLSRLLLLPSVLRAWRAAWMTGSID